MIKFSLHASDMHSNLAGWGWAERMGCSSTDTWEPPIDIYERKDSLVIVVALPGVDKDRIRISAEPGVLEVSACRPQSIPEGAQRVHHMEIPYGRFERTVRLPDSADVARIEAHYEQGCLTIEIPKA